MDSNNALHEFLGMDDAYNKKIMKACGLTQIPDRRTFDRRLKTISTDIKERIATMTSLSVHQKMIDPYIVAIDSTLLRAKGSIWHKSSMIKGVVPCSGTKVDLTSIIAFARLLFINHPISTKKGIYNKADVLY